ncbi:hypothetical protein IWQ56_006615, partial [Coemansia nantahalensis]
AALDNIRASHAALAAADRPRACDVTLALHALVADDQLVIAASGSRHSLPGFYDPAFGVPKSLFVRYRFRGALHEALVRDGEALAIPMRSHCIEAPRFCAFGAGLMARLPRLLRTAGARRCFSAKTHYDETAVYKYASQQIKPVSLGQLLKYRQLPLSAENILDSVSYSQAELPVRLAKRVISFHRLPFIVGTNPHIAQVYSHYYEAFDRLYAFPPITDLDAEWAFTRTLERQTQLLANVIPEIAQGFLECKQYMPREERTAFISELIRSRIGLRVIGEQHVALSFQFRNEQGTSNKQHQRQPDTQHMDDVWVGAIHTKLLPARMMNQCAQMVQNMCEMYYSTAPSYYVDGDVDETISYIPSHFEYIT